MDSLVRKERARPLDRASNQQGIEALLLFEAMIRDAREIWKNAFQCICMPESIFIVTRVGQKNELLHGSILLWPLVSRRPAYGTPLLLQHGLTV